MYVKINAFLFVISFRFVTNLNFLISMVEQQRTLRCDGEILHDFVANFISLQFTAVKNFENQLRFDKVIADYKWEAF